jgi:hypothetical protein
MEKIAFGSLPQFVQWATLAVPFIAWLLFAEWVIDRHGLDRWLPLYRVGNLCPWDIAVALILLGVRSWLVRKQAASQ